MCLYKKIKKLKIKLALKNQQIIKLNNNNKKNTNNNKKLKMNSKKIKWFQKEKN